MMPEKFFPTILIALDIGASLVYFYSLNWRMGFYWSAAALLTVCVTY